MREIFLILLSLMVKVLQTSGPCPASSGTLKYVERCPKTSPEWQERSLLKKCADINQNCTERENFQYHCLINELLNATVEVCAPVAQIVGSKCAEYNIIGERIQDNAELTCKECLFRYDSNLAHEYQECYARIKRGKGLYMKFEDTNTDTCPVGWFIAAIISIIFNVILGIFAACAIVQLQRRSTKKKSHLSPENPTPEDPCVHPPQNNAPDLTDKEGADNTTPARESSPLLSRKADPTQNDTRESRDAEKEHIEAPTKEESYSCVVAIQLGERYCGFAFSKGHDPANVLFDMAGSPRPRKTTTRLLLRKENGDKLKVDLFGKDACTEYNNKKRADHIYFDELNFEKKSGKLYIKDSEKKDHNAEEIYQKFLEPVVQYAQIEMKKEFKNHDTKFIFTVPNHWEELELELIKKVINEILGDGPRVEILFACLAVSPFLHEVKEEVLCHNFNVNNLKFIPGTKYAVLDLGSRFCDISILKVEQEKHGTDSKVDRFTDGWNDASPEKWFMTFLENAIGGDTLEDIRQKYPEIYFSMLHEFEDHKRTEGDMILHISSDFGDVVKEITKSAFETLITTAYDKNAMELEKDPKGRKWILKLKKEKAKDCFSKLIQKTKKLVQKHIQNQSDLKCVCMTGVYSKVEEVKDSMKQSFDKRTVVIPSNPDLVVAKGAAFLGHKLDTAANNEQ